MTTAPVFSPCEGGVLIASPSTFLREQVLHSLGDARWPVQQACGGADALVQLETGNWQVLFLDRRLPDLDAEELVGIIKQRFPGIEVVLLDSDSGTSRPVPPSGALENRHPSLGIVRNEHDSEAGALRNPPGFEVARPEALPGMIGSAPGMQSLYRMSRLIAPRNTTVLIVGATGTAKDLLCRMSTIGHGYPEQRQVNFLEEPSFALLIKECPPLGSFDWARFTFEMEAYVEEVQHLVSLIYHPR